jgi:hypothetical protein
LPSVEVDETTDGYLAFAALVAGLTKGEVVAQLVDLYRASDPHQSAEGSASTEGIPIHADYDGYRTIALFYSAPPRVEITEGPLAGGKFKSPSEAARAVVTHFKPSVSPHRNGWAFWVVTATGRRLETIRRSRGAEFYTELGHKGGGKENNPGNFANRSRDEIVRDRASVSY